MIQINFKLTHLLQLSLPLIMFNRLLVRFVSSSSLFQRCFFPLTQLKQQHCNYSTDHCTEHCTFPKFVRGKHSARLSWSSTNHTAHCWRNLWSIVVLPCDKFVLTRKQNQKTKNISQSDKSLLRSNSYLLIVDMTYMTRLTASAYAGPSNRPIETIGLIETLPVLPAVNMKHFLFDKENLILIKRWSK